MAADVAYDYFFYTAGLPDTVSSVTLTLDPLGSVTVPVS
jgi:hypothetical protein